MSDQYDHKKSDTELWHEFINDSQKALTTLYIRYYSQLYSYGLKLVGEKLMVEDTIQEIFLSLWKNRKQRSVVRSVKAYLFKALRWKIIRTRISEQNRVARNNTFAQGQSDFVLSHEEFLIDGELKNEQKALLQKALNKLSKRQQEALYLKFYHGLNYEQIAEVMQITNQTVRNYVFEALQTLRKQLQNVLISSR